MFNIAFQPLQQPRHYAAQSIVFHAEHPRRFAHGVNFGSGDGTLTGGKGLDYFLFKTSGGYELVCDFNMSLGGRHTADQRDMSDRHNVGRSPVQPWGISVSGTGHGQALLSFPGGEGAVSVLLKWLNTACCTRWWCSVLLRALGLHDAKGRTGCRKYNGRRCGDDRLCPRVASALADLTEL